MSQITWSEYIEQYSNFNKCYPYFANTNMLKDIEVGGYRTNTYYPPQEFKIIINSSIDQGSIWAYCHFSVLSKGRIAKGAYCQSGVLPKKRWTPI